MAWNISKAKRQALVKLQLRDKKGRWIEMGRSTKWYDSLAGKEMSGVVVGSKGNKAIVALTGAPDAAQGLKTVDVDMGELEMVGEKATLLSPEIQKLVADSVMALTGKEVKQYEARNKAIEEGKAAQSAAGVPETDDSLPEVKATLDFEDDEVQESDTESFPELKVKASANQVGFSIQAEAGSTPVMSKVGDLKVGDKLYPISSGQGLKSIYNKQSPSMFVNVDKYPSFKGKSEKGLGEVTSVKENAYAVITMPSGDTIAVSHKDYAMKQNPYIDKAIGIATEAEAKSIYANKDAPIHWTDTLKESANKLTKEPKTVLTEDDFYKPEETFQYFKSEPPVDVSKWEKIPNTQGGSNPGGIYIDPEGKKYYVKHSKSAMHAKNEVLADKFYELTGIPTSQLKLADIDGKGKLGTLSPMLEGSKNDFKSKALSDAEYRQKFQEGFAVDAWLANWDVVGLAYDNALTNAEGDPTRIDPGGALLFRAMGDPKGQAFGNNVGEWDSMRKGNNTASQIFGSMDENSLSNSAQKVAAVTDEQIAGIVDSMDFDPTTADFLKTTLANRRKNVIDKAKITPKAKPEEVVTQKAVPEEIVETAPELNFAEEFNGTSYSDNNGNKVKKTGADAWKSYDENGLPTSPEPLTDSQAQTLAKSFGYTKDAPKLINDNEYKVAQNALGIYHKDGKESFVKVNGQFGVAWSMITPENPEGFPLSTQQVFHKLKDNPDTYFADTGDILNGGALTPEILKSALNDEEKESLADNDSIIEYGEKYEFSGFPGYNNAEYTAIKNYVDNSDVLNNVLRGKGGDADSALVHIAAMDQIMDKSALLDDVTVYRGIRMRPEKLQGLLDNKMYKDWGYSSTSDESSVATEWAGDSNFDGKTAVMLSIELPKGFKAHKVDYDATDLQGDFGHESEVILPRNTAIDITSIEEYTTPTGGKGYKAVGTPILTENNYIGDNVNGQNTDTTGTGDDTGAGDTGGSETGPANDGLGESTVSDDGGSGSDEVQEPSPAQEADQGPVNASDYLTGGKDASSFENADVKDFLDSIAKDPSFAFPNKGKQASANGNTFEANSQVVSPKFGKGIAAIILPSTNSVKVLYADHGYKVTKAEALTPAETIAKTATPIDIGSLAPGENGIDPATGKLFIVGKNNVALTQGDSVSYTKKGETNTGKVASIYKGTKSAKVEWPDGTTTTIKASQLVGEASEPTPSPAAPETPAQEVTAPTPEVDTSQADSLPLGTEVVTGDGDKYTKLYEDENGWAKEDSGVLLSPAEMQAVLDAGDIEITEPSTPVAESDPAPIDDPGTDEDVNPVDAIPEVEEYPEDDEEAEEETVNNENTLARLDAAPEGATVDVGGIEYIKNADGNWINLSDPFNDAHGSSYNLFSEYSDSSFTFGTEIAIDKPIDTFDDLGPDSVVYNPTFEISFKKDKDEDWIDVDEEGPYYKSAEELFDAFPSNSWSVTEEVSKQKENNLTAYDLGSAGIYSELYSSRLEMGFKLEQDGWYSYDNGSYYGSSELLETFHTDDWQISESELDETYQYGLTPEEDRDEFPIGSKISYAENTSDSPNEFVKVAPDQWVELGYDGKPSYNADTMGNSGFEDGYSSILSTDAEDLDFAPIDLSSMTYNEVDNNYVNEDYVAGLPVGTIVATSSDPSIMHKKVDTNSWNTQDKYGNVSPYATNANDDKVAESAKAPIHVWTPTPPEEPMADWEKELLEGGNDPVPAPEDLNVSDLPVGTFVPTHARQVATTGFVKTGDNTWVMQVSGQNIGQEVTDDFVQSVYDVNKPSINAPETPKPEDTATPEGFSPDKPFFQYSVSEIEALPTGTTVLEDNTGKWVMIKDENGFWRLKDVNKDTYDDSVSKVSSDALASYGVNTSAPFVLPERAETPSIEETPELTGTVTGITDDMVTDAPIGSVIKTNINHPGWTKLSEDNWQYNAGSKSNHSGSDFFALPSDWTITYPNASEESVAAPEPTPTPEANAPYPLAPLDGDTDAFEALPIGTKLIVEGGINAGVATKNAQGSWDWVGDSGYTKTFLSGIMAGDHPFNKEAMVHLPEAVSAPVAENKAFKDMSAEEIGQLPVGSKIQWPASGDAQGFFGKQADNAWILNKDAGYSSGIPFTDAQLSSGNYNAKIDVPPILPDQPVISEDTATAPKALKDMTAEEFAALPVGTTLPRKSGGIYTKLGDNIWQVTTSLGTVGSTPYDNDELFGTDVFVSPVEVPTLPTATSDVPTNKTFSTATVADLDSFPEGTYISDKDNDGWGYKKNSVGKWKMVSSKDKETTTSGISSAAMLNSNKIKADQPFEFPEDSAPEATVAPATKSMKDMTSSEVAALPVGTTIDWESGGSTGVFVKDGADDWKIFVNGNKNTTSFNDNDVSKTEMYGAKINNVPTLPSTTPVAPAFDPHDFSKENFDKLPIGAKVSAPNATLPYTKVGENQWSLPGDPDSTNNTIPDANLIGLPSSWTISYDGPVAEPFSTQDLSSANVTNAPVGATITSPAGGAVYIKAGPNQWTNSAGSSSYDDGDFIGLNNSWTLAHPAEATAPTPQTVFNGFGGAEAANAPVGSKIKSAGGNIYEKSAPNVWKTTEGFAYSDANFDGMPSTWTLEYATAPVAKAPKDYTIAELDALPVGSYAKWGGAYGGYANLVKKTNGKWQVTTPGNPTNSELDGMYTQQPTSYVHNSDIDQDTPIVIPNGAAPVAPTAPKVTGNGTTELKPVGEYTAEELDLFPAGTFFSDKDNDSNGYKKAQDGKWTTVGSIGTSTPTQGAYTSEDVVNGNISYWGPSKPIILPEGEIDPTAITVVEPYSAKEKLTSLEDVAALPVGTILTPSNDDSTYQKVGVNSWKIGNEENELFDTDIFVPAWFESSGISVKEPSKDALGNPLVYIPQGTNITALNKAGFDAIPVGGKIEYASGEKFVGTYEKLSANTWGYTKKGSPKPNNNNIGNDAFHVLFEDDYTIPSSAIYTIKDYDTPEADTVAPEETGPAPTTLYHQTMNDLTVAALDGFPVGTTIKPEQASYYGQSKLYAVKQADGTWMGYKKNAKTLGKTEYAAHQLNYNIVSNQNTVQIPTAPKFFNTSSGQLAYVGDTVLYEGNEYTVEKIFKTGIDLKSASGDKAKVKPKDITIANDPNFGVPATTAPTNNGSAVSNSTPAPIVGESQNYATIQKAKQKLENFAGAKAEAYNEQGLKVKSALPKPNALDVLPQAEADPSNPLYGTPQPVSPGELEYIPPFDESLPANLPKWDADGDWLKKVEQRYLDNPNKAKSSVQESNNWGTIQQALDDNNESSFKQAIKKLLDNKYLDQDLYDEAVAKREINEEAKKPLIAAHKASLKDAKAAHDAMKKAKTDEHKAKVAEYDSKMSDWAKANPNKDAIILPVFPKPSTQNFEGGDADWDKAHIGTFTANDALAAIKADNNLAKVGVSVATDGDKIEDLDVHIKRVVDLAGTEVLDLRFKITSSYADVLEGKLKAQEGVQTKSSVELPHFELDKATGLLKEKSGTKHSTHGQEFTYTDPTSGAKITFQRPSSKTDIMSNAVRITMPVGSTSADYEAAITSLGIDAKPSTEGDIRIYAENRFIATMLGNHDGSDNPTGAAREKAFKDIKDKYDITVDDLVYSVNSHGRVKATLTDEAAQKLVDKTKVSSFHHNLSSSDPETLFLMLTEGTTGIVSTYQRWQNGIHTSGMSSSHDTQYHGGDYIFTKPVHGNSGGGSGVVINAKAALKRLDLYGNQHDSFGAFSNSSPSVYKLMEGNPYEIMFRHAVPVSDWDGLVLGSQSTVTNLIERLKKAGILKINGVPVEQFVVTNKNQLAGLSGDVLATTVVE